MALLLVLAVVALLTSLLVELAFSTLIDLRLVETYRDSARAYYLAKGGVSAGRMLLQDDQNSYDGLDETWNQGVVDYPVGQGTVTIRIADQNGKLAVNALVSGNNPNTVMVDRFYRLFEALQLSALADPAELTAALIDWLDSGDDPYREILTGGANLPVAGAEQGYYSTLQDAYRCKNGPVETFEELSLIKGFTPEVLRRLRPHLAITAQRQVNINTASPEVLMALDPEVDRGIAETIVANRREQPIILVDQLEELLPEAPYRALKTLANLEQLVTTSSIYRIDSQAAVGDGRRRVSALVEKPGNQLLLFKVN